MKPLTPEKPEARLQQSSMALVGAILAFGVIRKLDKASTGEPTISSRNEMLMERLSSSHSAKCKREASQ